MGRRALVLIVALVLAGAAAFAIFQYLQGVQEEAEANQERVTVYRALQPIAQGTEGSQILQGEGTLFTESYEIFELLPDGAPTNRQELETTLAGKVAVAAIPANQLFTSSQWVTLTTQITPLSELIGEGLQAITISPGSVQGINGFPNPGDRINVIVSLDIEANLIDVGQAPDLGLPQEPPAEGEGAAAEEETITVQYTRYVLQGLPVIAVGRDVRPEQDGNGEDTTATTIQTQAPAEGEQAQEVSTVYTLEVTPEQAERLVYAQNNGSIYLTLVPPDFVEVDTLGVTIETLFEGDLVDDIFNQ